MEENPVLVLFDLGGDFAEGEEDGRGLRLGEGGLLSGVRTEGRMEDRGGTCEEEPHRMGQDSGGRRAGAVEVMLHRLAIVFAIATGAIEVFGAPLGGRRLQGGHHKAGVIVLLHDFRLEDDPPGLRPGPCGRDKLVIETATRRGRLTMGLGQRDPLAMETPRRLQSGRGLAQQDGLASEAKNTIRPAGGDDDVDALRGGTMTLAADQHVGVGPVVPQRRQQPDHDHRMCGPGRAGARTQGGRDQGMRRPFEHAERQRALVLRVMMIERTLLLAIRRIVRVVSIQDNGGGGLGVAGAAVVHQGTCEAIEIFAVNVVLQTRARRGTGSGMGWVQGWPLHAEFQHRVTAETLGVIGVRIPRGELRDTLGEEVPSGMIHRGRMALIMDGGGQARGEPHLPVDPA